MHAGTQGRRPALDVVLLVIVLLPLFVLNARWGVEANVDSIAAAAPAWQIVENGTLDLSAYKDSNPWFVPDKNGRIVSDRFPGLIASAVPGYAVWRTTPFTNGPATLIALLATLMATLVLWYLLFGVVGRWPAFSATLIFALGTTTWSVSSSQLWPHGPGQLAALLGLAFIASNRFASAGAAAAYAVTLRPVTSVYVALLGVVEGWRARSARPTIIYGVVAALGVVAVLGYNNWLFGSWTLRGGHDPGLGGGFAFDFSFAAYLENLWVMLFSMRHGFLTLSPFLLVGVFGLIAFRPALPSWARSAAIAALAYILVHAALNRASGGAILFYRYPLEAIALSAVALAMGAVEVFKSGLLGRTLVTGSALAAIAIQVANVFVLSCTRGSPSTLACTLF